MPAGRSKEARLRNLLTKATTLPQQISPRFKLYFLTTRTPVRSFEMTDTTTSPSFLPAGRQVEGGTTEKPTD